MGAREQRPRRRALGARLEDKGAQGALPQPTPHTPGVRSLPAAKYRYRRRDFKDGHRFSIDGLIFSVEAPAISTPTLPSPRSMPAIPVTQATRASPRLGAKLAAPPHAWGRLPRQSCAAMMRHPQIVHLGLAFQCELSHVAHEVTGEIPGDWVTV